MGSTVTAARSVPPLKKLSAEEAEKISGRLGSLVGADGVSLAGAVRSQHGQDEGPDLGLPPDVVAYPKSVEEVSEVWKGSSFILSSTVKAIQ